MSTNSARVSDFSNLLSINEVIVKFWSAQSEFDYHFVYIERKCRDETCTREPHKVHYGGYRGGRRPTEWQAWARAFFRMRSHSEKRTMPSCRIVMV